MDVMVDPCSIQNVNDGSKGIPNKAKERRVQINNLDINNKLKKHYENIQVTFKSKEDKPQSNGVNKQPKIEKEKEVELPKTPVLDEIPKNECHSAPVHSETDDLAILLARIHRKDDDTVQLLTAKVEFLTAELAKRNSIIYSLLKHLDFAINEDIATVRTNKQLNQYLNNNKEVYIKDVLSSSRWNVSNENENENARISEDDWQLDIFQYIKNYIDNIDTILMPSGGPQDESADANQLVVNGVESENSNSVNLTDTIDSCSIDCDQHKLYVRAAPELPDLDSLALSCDDLNTLDDPVWPPDTIAVIGDQMLHGIDEKRLGGKNWTVKVRMFPESHVCDFFHYVTPILGKKPSHLVFHMGTNDTPHYSPRDIYEGMMALRRYVEKYLPACKVIISKPIIRMDNCQANLTVLKVNSLLDNTKILTIDNGNFGLNHLSRKGPNLNPKGTARLAMNIISQLKSMLNEGGPAHVGDKEMSSDPAICAAEGFFKCSKLNPDAKSFNPLPMD